MAAEKVSVNFTFTAPLNSGGHSSMPRPDNAIYELSKALLKVSEFEFHVVLNPVTTAYLLQSSESAAERRVCGGREDDRRQTDGSEGERGPRARLVRPFGLAHDVRGNTTRGRPYGEQCAAADRDGERELPRGADIDL